MTRIATRNGQPAYLDPPAPIKAGVTMADWQARDRDDEPPRSWAEIAFTIAVFVGLTVGTIWFCWRISL